MSGRNQHSIPQAVLRQFRVANRRGEPQVHVYHRDRDYPSPVRAASAQKDFFSSPGSHGETTLDDVMTSYENGPFNTEWTAIIRHPGGQVDAGIAARVIGHLAGRTHHLRGIMRSGASAMGEMVERSFADEAFIARMFDAAQDRPGENFERIALDFSENSQLAQLGVPAPALRNILHFMSRENQRELTATLSMAASRLGQMFKDNAFKLSRDAHAKSLGQSLTSERRLETLQRFDWRILECDTCNFLLPDFVCLGFDAAGNAGSIFDVRGDDLAEIWTPISPTRMLVGYRSQPRTNVESFNALAVPFCFDFFISAAPNGDLKRLSQLIGTKAFDKIDEGLAEAADEFRVRAEGSRSPSAKESSSRRQAPPSNIRLETDCLNQVNAERLADVLGHLVGVAARRFDLASLSRFIVPADYEAKIAELWDSQTPAGESLERARGTVAYNVSSKDGEIHIVVNLATVSQLLSDDVTSAGQGCSVVMAQLARIGAANVLQGVFREKVQLQAHERLTLDLVLQAWVLYIVALNHGFFNPAYGRRARDELLLRLAELPGQLNDLKAAHSAEQGEALTLAALLTVSGVLALACEAVASVIAEADDAELHLFREGLAKLGLSNWFELLRAELAGIWVPGDGYPAPDKFKFLLGHVERLLLLGGLFLYEEEGIAKYWILGWPTPEPDQA